MFIPCVIASPTARARFIPRNLRNVGALALMLLAAPALWAQTPTLLDPTTSQVSAGGYHTCALNTDGGVKCWGYNFLGELGNPTNSGTTAANAAPLDVTGLSSGVATIAAGDYHACALTTGGGVKCWGNNLYGELGNATNVGIYSATPLDVTGLSSGVASIAAGEGDHVCALTTGGGVKCWGDNEYGELGNPTNAGTTNANATPLDVTGLSSGVTAITVGGYHTCALTTGGGVKCWGYNQVGQLGNATNVGTYSTTPLDVSGLSSGVLAIAAGGNHTCAMITGGTVKCWGYNFFGQLGNTANAGTTTVNTTPLDVTGLSGVASVTAGQFHTCALTTGGGVKCWGNNGRDALGNPVNAGTGTPNTTPLDVTNLTSGVALIAANSHHTCAVTTGGAVKCWGYNSSGQLGNNSIADSVVPIAVVGFATAAVLPTPVTPASAVTLPPQQITTGQYYSCAVTTAGGAKCWGWNHNGELGNNSTVDSAVPVAVSGPLGIGTLGDVTAITGSGYHTCALTTAGTVQCWGDNSNGGQLGNNKTTLQMPKSTTPVAVSGVGGAGTLSSIKAITSGEGGFHTCALTTAGTVVCWGFNSHGQLGNDSTVASPFPVTVKDSLGTGTLTGVVAIAVGANHSCALTATGGVQCWGNNEYGQIGGPLPVGYSYIGLPVVVRDSTGVNPLSGVVAIASANAHNCALTSAGAVFCWGNNVSGQLGNNLTANSQNPVAVKGLGGVGTLSGVTAVATGYAQSCALTTAGAMLCWGHNGSGQLGDNTTTERHVPVAVKGPGGVGTLSGVAAIASGGLHTCALTTAGGLLCWGNNFDGELGNNSTTNRSTPVNVQSGQSLGFTPPATQPAGTTLSLNAVASGGGLVSITYDSWTPDTCTVSGNVVTANARALCGVRASRVGGDDGSNGTTATAPQQLRLIQVTPGTPVIALTSSLNPSVVGQSVTSTATLGNATGISGNLIFCADAPTPDATCTGGTLLCTVATSASPIACSTSSLVAASHAITAFYPGDSNFNAASGSLTGNPQVVNKAGTTTTLTPPAGITLGQSVSVTVTVAVTAPGSGTPTGTILISDGSASCTITLPATSCSLTPTSAGNKPLTVTYSGDTNFAGSSTTGSLAVGTNATAITLTSSPNPSTVGQMVTLTATVTVLPPASSARPKRAGVAGEGAKAAAILTGSVTFSDGATVLGTVPLNAVGVATFSTATLTQGSRTITASYSGDANSSVAVITAVQAVGPVPLVPISGWLLLLMAALLAVMGAGTFRRGRAFS